MFLLALLVVSAFGSRREEVLADVLMQLLEGEEEVAGCDTPIADMYDSRNSGLESCSECFSFGCTKGVCPGGGAQKKGNWGIITKCLPPANTGKCIYKEGSDRLFVIGSKDNWVADCGVANGNEALCGSSYRANYCTWTGKVTIHPRVPLKAADVMRSCAGSGNQCADSSSFTMYDPNDYKARNCNHMCTPFLASGKYYGGKGSCKRENSFLDSEYDTHEFEAVYSRSACFEKSEQFDKVTAVEYQPYYNKCSVFTGNLHKLGGGTGELGDGRRECYQRCSYSDQSLAKKGTAGERWVGCHL